MRTQKYKTYYVWDVSSDDSDRKVYAVEYRGKEGKISYSSKEVAINKARRIAFEKTGNRKIMRRTNENFYPYQEGLEIVKVPFKTKQLKEWKGKTRKAIAEFEFGDEFDFEMFYEALKEKMGKNTYFKVVGKNINWLGDSGFKYIQAETAEDLLKAFHYEDILRLYNGKKGNHFEINAPTHDTPMGSYYYFTPISERTFNTQQ